MTIRKITDLCNDGREVYYIESPPWTQKFYFSAAGDPNKWEGLKGGIWCGTPPVARFIAKYANRILRWWESQ